MPELVSKRPKRRSAAEPDLTVLGVRPPIVLLPSVNAWLTMLLNRQPPRGPTLAGVGAPAPVERQVGFHNTKPLGDHAHQLSSFAGFDEVAIPNLRDEGVVAAERTDPVFVPRGMSVSAAELDPAVKNRLSHRGQALRKLIESLSAVPA